jgi:hypothetical protein
MIITKDKTNMSGEWLSLSDNILRNYTLKNYLVFYAKILIVNAAVG